MALLGAQLVITLIMVSIIQKLGSHFSIARWILCSTGLYRFLYPDDNELKTLAGVPKDRPKSKKGKHEQNGQARAFHIPRNLEIELETALVSPLDVIHLRYYSEYQWLLDFSLYSLLVYILSEIFNGFFPLKDDVNLSMVWCFLVVGFAFKMLITLALQYFQGNESMGERSTCIVAGCGFLLVAMMVLIIDEKNLETGLDTAYDSFYESASEFLKTQGISSNGPASKLILKLSVAVWCGIIGALFIFPGMRMARMHWDSLRYCKDSKLMSLLLNASFASPFVLILLWIKPVSRDYLTERIFSGMEKPLLTSAAFESIRLWCVVLAVVLRLCLMPVYLQAYLNMAHHRLELQKKEAGRITNVDLQKKIAAVFYYLCVVTLQYLCPIIMCLYLTLMYKTLGGYTWTGFLYENTSSDTCVANKSFIKTIESETGETSIVESAQQFQMAFDNMKSIFTEEVLRGLFGFSAWWCCFTWFATTALGLVYQSYFRIA